MSRYQGGLPPSSPGPAPSPREGAASATSAPSPLVVSACGVRATLLGSSHGAPPAQTRRWSCTPCSTPEDAAAANGGLGSSAGGGSAPPDDALLSSEQWQWDAIPNLDQFFTRIYRWVLQGAAGRWGTLGLPSCAAAPWPVCCLPQAPLPAATEQPACIPAYPPACPPACLQVLGGEGICGDADSKGAQPGSPGLHL